MPSSAINVTSGTYTIAGQGCFVLRGENTDFPLLKVSGGEVNLGDFTGSDSDPSITFDGRNISCASPAVSVDGGKLNFYIGSMITGCINTSDGGAAEVINGGTMNILGGAITENHAANGGALYLKSGTVNHIAGTVKRNGASQCGGAVYADSESQYNAGQIELTENYAGECGGAVYTCDSANLMLMECQISYNLASQKGAGLYLEGESVLSDCALVHNDAKLFDETEIDDYFKNTDKNSLSDKLDPNEYKNTSAGAVYNSGILKIKSGNIVYNNAETASAIYNSGKAELEEVSINYNNASESASAANYGRYMMKGGSLSSNNACKACGGLLNFGEFTLDGGSVSSNTSKKGFEFGTGIVNGGKLTLKGEAFISFNNDVVVIYGETGSGEVIIDGELTANTPVATLTPASDENIEQLKSGKDLDKNIHINYISGQTLISGSLDQYDRLAVSDLDGRAYNITSDGKLKDAGSVGASESEFSKNEIILFCLLGAGIIVLAPTFILCASRRKTLVYSDPDREEKDTGKKGEKTTDKNAGNGKENDGGKNTEKDTAASDSEKNNPA